MKKFNNIKTIIFDIGETLCTRAINTEKQEEIVAEEVSNLLRKKGYQITKQFYQKLKDKIWNDWKENVKRSGEEFKLEDFLAHLLEQINIPPKDRSPLILEISKIIYKHDRENSVLKPTVMETLQKLRDRGYLLGVISNSSYSYDHILRILKKLRIKDFFTEVLVSSHEGVTKPHIRIFKKALSKLDVQPEEAIFIGDNPEVDIPGAKAIGMKVFLIADEKINIDRIQADGILKNLADIFTFLPKTEAKRRE
jgi:putative hydrolase of the HAD superfamily